MKKVVVILGILSGFFSPVWAEIPEQVSLENPRYNDFFITAAEQVDDTKNECAKFVNRLFSARFKNFIWGNAWDLQTRAENKKFLTLSWKLDDDEALDADYRLRNPEDRLKHFEDLYETVDRLRYPIGVMGFMYRYSFSRDIIKKSADFFPQTHVNFLSGAKLFGVRNESDLPQTVRALLEERYGKIHDFEEDFVNTRLNVRKKYAEKFVTLDTVLSPQEQFWYQDYMIEEQFQFARKDSLLGIFLRKHRNNKTTSLLRPVSFSRISDILISDIEAATDFSAYEQKF